MVRAIAIRAVPSSVESVERSAAQTREGASSASGLPEASTPVSTPVDFRKLRRSTDIHDPPANARVTNTMIHQLEPLARGGCPRGDRTGRRGCAVLALPG